MITFTESRFEFIENASLSEKQFDDLLKLFEINFEHDQSKPKIYLEIIKFPRSVVSNFLVYDNSDETNASILVAYFTFFLFEPDTEIVGIVHPNYRQKGIFTGLFQHAAKHFVRLNISSVIAGFAQKNAAPKLLFKKLMGTFFRYEYHMEWKNHPFEMNEQTQKLCEFTIATLDDASLIADIDSKCFETNALFMQERLQYTLRDFTRLIWLIWYDGICIGKLHVLFEETETACIHDVCILPEYQKHGFGKILMQFAMHELTKFGLKTLNLQVLAHNDSALKLYKKCGFEVAEIYEYWRLPIIDQT